MHTRRDILWTLATFSRSALAAGALVVVAQSAKAQQVPGAAGIVSAPRPSPVLPDIVAFERIVDDRQDLMFAVLSRRDTARSVIRGAGKKATGTLALPDLNASGRRLASFAGQLDWRPVEDARRRSWFAYIQNNERGEIALYLDAFDESGRLTSDKSLPIVIPFAGQPRMPRWSPNGDLLAFVSDSAELYMVSNLPAVLRGTKGAVPAVKKVFPTRHPLLFPAWSPRGDHLAYSVETTVRGNRNLAIEVLPVDSVTGVAAAGDRPVIVTGEMVGDNEYRPSWSLDGRQIAFYADQAGLGGSKQEVSIGIVNLLYRQQTGKVVRGSVAEGATRWLAENVVPDGNRGPAWVEMLVGASRRSFVSLARRRAEGGTTLVLGFPEAWERGDTSAVETPLSRAEWETGSDPVVNPKSIASVEMLSAIRFVFTSVKGGQDVVQFRDQEAPWARGPVPNVLAVTSTVASAATGEEKVETKLVGIYASRGQVVVRAVMLPGGGQFAMGKRSKGLTLLAGGATGVGLAVMSFAGMSAQASAADDAISSKNYGAYSAAKSAFDSKRGMNAIGSALFVAAWGYGIMDAASYRPSQGRSSLSVLPVVLPSGGRGGPSVGVGFSFGPRRP